MRLREALGAVQQQPERAEHWAVLGALLEKNGLHREATESYERAIYLDPTREEWYEALWAIEERRELPLWLSELSSITMMEEPEASRALAQYSTRHDSTRQQRTLLLVGTVVLVGLVFLVTTLGLYGAGRVLNGDQPTSTMGTAPAPDYLGQTTLAPAPPGTPLLLDEGMQATVLGVPDAKRFAIRYYYDFDGDGEKEWRDGTPPEGLRPFVVRLMVENVAGEEEPYFDLFDMTLVSDELVSYNAQCGIVPEEVDSLAVLRRGERTEGNLCLLVGEEAAIKHLVYDSYELRRYFALP